MARNPACSVYIGNLDEKVSERILYEILIQVGRVVDLHIPRDKETNRHKGFAFAEYETKETANYAVRLFSGLVRLHNKTLKFAMSGQDKSSQNSSSPLTPQANCPPLPNNGPSPLSVQSQDIKLPQVSAQAMVNCRISSGAPSVSPVYPQGDFNFLRSLQGLIPQLSINFLVLIYVALFTVYSNGLVNNGLSTSNYEYNRRVFGDVLNSVSRPATRHPIAYPSY